MTELTPAKQIRNLQILIVAMAAGLLVFGVIINAVIDQVENPRNGVLTQFGIGFGLVALVLHRVIGSVLLSTNMRRLPDDEDPARQHIMRAKTISMIVACAVLEGAAFYNLAAYGFLEGQPISLAMAALLWFAIVIKFPLPGVLENWMERELRAAREERDLNPTG